MNISTKCVVPPDITKDIVGNHQLGEEIYISFVNERLLGEKHFFDPMKKLKFQSWKSTRKSQKVKIGKDVIELKENRSLFARMAIAAKSRTDIDLAKDIGTYEFSCVSRALFGPDGSLLASLDKSKLTCQLENLSKQDNTINYISEQQRASRRCIIIDGMVVVQGIGSINVASCKEFGQEFVRVLSAQLLKTKLESDVHVLCHKGMPFAVTILRLNHR